VRIGKRRPHVLRYARRGRGRAQAVQVSALLSEATFTDLAGQTDSRYQVRALNSSGELSDPTPSFGPAQ